MSIFLDGTFGTGKKCKFHCYPSCHPGQVDEERRRYGCLHPEWPENRKGEFCPLVDCDGDILKCELLSKKGEPQ